MIPAKEIKGEQWIKASDLNRVVNREWVGLTDEEIHELDWMNGMTREDRIELIKHAESKLREKNLI